MREYRRIRKGALCFLAVCFTGGLLTLLRLDREVFDREVFPFFSWSLFALTPQAGPQYGLLLLEVNGRAVDPPRLFEEADGLVAAPHSVTVFQLAQIFGAAVEAGRADREHYRELLEKNWLPPRTKYELVKFNSDPIARFQQGGYEITQRLGTFTSAGAVP